MPHWIKSGALGALILLGIVGYFMMHRGSDTSAVRPTTAAATDGSDFDDATKRPAVRDFTLTDAEGKQKKLSDFRGSVVILSFWASWCTPCLIELPTFAKIESQLRERGLKVLAVNVDEGPDGKSFAKDLWTKNKFAFPSFFDSTKQLEQQFEVDMLPSNFVIDRQGRLAFSGFGANDWSNPQTKEFIESLLVENVGQNSGQSSDQSVGGGAPPADK